MATSPNDKTPVRAGGMYLGYQTARLGANGARLSGICLFPFTAQCYGLTLLVWNRYGHVSLCRLSHCCFQRAHRNDWQMGDLGWLVLAFERRAATRNLKLCNRYIRQQARG